MALSLAVVCVALSLAVVCVALSLAVVCVALSLAVLCVALSLAVVCEGSEWISHATCPRRGKNTFASIFTLGPPPLTAEIVPCLGGR